MSLLLDALRRAEEAKRAKQPGKPDSDEASAPPPSETPAAAGAKSLKIAEESLSVPARAAQKMGSEGGAKAKTPGRALDFALEDVETPHAHKATKSPALPPASAAIAATPTAASVAVDSQQRDAVRNMFQAKRTESKAAGNRPGWMLPAIAVGIVAIGAGGWYVWNEVNSISKPLAMAPRPALPAPPPGLPAPAPGTGQVAAQPSAPAAAAQPVVPPLLPPPAPETVEDVKRQVATAPGISANERLASEIRIKPPRKEPALSLAPSKGPVAKPVSDDLSSAYAALRSGDTRQAVALYEKVLSGDPQSLDARLGLAAAAMRGGDSELAARHFREALALDPRNDYALAGLASMNNDARAERAESVIRNLLTQHPDGAALHFSLGNALAAQRRWTEAQQSYFEAWRLEPERADFAFNLAVSLDQLRQGKLAEEYYRKALALAGRGGAQFDKAVASRRLAELASENK